MDIKTSKALNLLKLYEEYTRKEVHETFGDGSKFVSEAGIWGRYGVVKPKLQDDVYLLFCIIKTDVSNRHLQYIDGNGYFHWISPPSMYYGDKKLESMITASKGESKVLLFAKPGAGPKYTHLGKLSYVTAEEDVIRPAIVTWKIIPWPISSEMKARFGVP